MRIWSLLTVLFLGPLLLGAEQSVERHLQRYVGRWAGHFTIHSAATGYTETFPVEQQYWWEDGTLRGIAVAERGEGMEVSRSRTFVDEGRLISEVKQDSGDERFYGALHEGGIVWLSAAPGRAEDYQMRENIVMKDGQRILRTEGFDSYVYQGGLAYIIYRGELAFGE